VLITSSIAALALPLAIGILARSRLALRLTQLYLWLAVIAGCAIGGTAEIDISKKELEEYV
jgi:hypothetical protein